MKSVATVENLTYTIQEAGRERSILKNINYDFEQGMIYTISCLLYTSQPEYCIPGSEAHSTFAEIGFVSIVYPY